MPHNLHGGEASPAQLSVVKFKFSSLNDKRTNKVLTVVLSQEKPKSTFDQLFCGLLGIQEFVNHLILSGQIVLQHIHCLAFCQQFEQLPSHFFHIFNSFTDSSHCKCQAKRRILMFEGILVRHGSLGKKSEYLPSLYLKPSRYRDHKPFITKGNPLFQKVVH